MEEAFQSYTLPEAFRLLDRFCKVPGKAKLSWKKLLAWLSTLEERLQHTIRETATATPGSKRKRKLPSHPTSPPSKRIRTETNRGNKRSATGHTTASSTVQSTVSADFLRVPDEQIVESCISKFIDLTGNAALSKKTCIVCARRLFVAKIETIDFNSIPNRHVLQPTHSHPHQRTVEGLLFHDTVNPEGLNDVCSTCLIALRRCSRPKLAVANNMWIGNVPFQLEILTLPEQLLIALYFPAAYIMKVYPAKIRYRASASKTDGMEPIAINEKLRGNVSTFRLPTAQIVNMAAGQIVPRPSLILASLIGVTFVGVDRKALALPSLKTMFRVRRHRVWEALLWLKQNNSIYRDVTIDSSAIERLPEDDIPLEITENVRYSNDVDAVRREHAGYAPLESELEDPEQEASVEWQRETFQTAHDEICDPPVGYQPEPRPGDKVQSALLSEYSSRETAAPAAVQHATMEDPAVFPLHVHGVIDVGGDNIPESTVFAHAVNNLVSNPFAQDYAVRKGSAFINEYGRRDENGERYDGGPSNPNHLLGAFPTLFPYGLGGLEVDREDTVSYEDHVRWALQHDSGRFRRHTHFIFLVFGVLWKRQVCRSASIQIDRSNFLAFQSSLSQLRPKDLLKAAEEEEHKVQISNPLIRLLRKHLTAVRARVQGTDENRVAIRAQIWGMTLKFNPPSIWMTINLSDTGDPIAQVLAGQEINLDDFVARSGPNATTRDGIIGADPFAAAEYFHLVIRLLLREMLGIKVGERGAITRNPGVLGEVNAYIGTVEAQGRGSLHLHLLLWLHGAPTATKMQEALQSDEFRSRVKLFIKHNIRADVPGGPFPPQMRKRLTRSVAFSRPIDPRKN
ncbi:ATP-dependent DNA helicase [Mycena indigotica]|uniref:ATP-dependent DNA helicase n=1 Tax=Mycena indigotica TaxID=2126181 RepID=A0A8H6TDM9_9AGAR|nr:ATP-dependent DNA helicase [Mycena indigotica]KAF7315758.1 ATP-dependent DNA helicase [Mycena indigotica]